MDIFAGFMHHYSALPRDYYEQLTAEKLVPHQNKNGFYSKVRVLPSGHLNDALDLEKFLKRNIVEPWYLDK